MGHVLTILSRNVCAWLQGDAAGQPEVVPADPAAVSPVLEEAAAASALGTGRRAPLCTALQSTLPADPFQLA